jgi:hypothetical protein
MPATAAATFAAVGFALYAAHHVADHWIQTQHQADNKGREGWPGRTACAAHVVTYTATAALALAALVTVLGVSLAALPSVAGLAVSAITHYVADRRTPLRRIADWLGSGKFYRLAGAGMNGAYLLDQSWHVGWLFVAALIIA